MVKTFIQFDKHLHYLFWNNIFYKENQDFFTIYIWDKTSIGTWHKNFIFSWIKIKNTESFVDLIKQINKNEESYSIKFKNYILQKDSDLFLKIAKHMMETMKKIQIEWKWSYSQMEILIKSHKEWQKYIVDLFAPIIKEFFIAEFWIDIKSIQEEELNITEEDIEEMFWI